MTPRIIEMVFEAYQKRVERQLQLIDNTNYLLGRYIAIAVNDPKKYPSEPVLYKKSRASMSTDIEAALRRVALGLGAKHGSNHSRRTEGTDHRTK